MRTVRGSQSPALLHGDENAKRKEILEYFIQTYRLYESLFDSLGCDESFYVRADPLRHPLIFYFGHTATFYVNKLLHRGLTSSPIDQALEEMLAVGVDEMSWDDLDETHYNWPSVAYLRRYRDLVFELVANTIENLELKLPITWDDPFWIILMAIEHERIHLETSSVLIRQLPLQLVRTDSAWMPCPVEFSKRQGEGLASVEIEGGEVEIGREHPSDTYGWDNEFGCERAHVAGFSAMRSTVSNADFLQFVEAGGYENPRWWTPEGVAWREFKRADKPIFWLGRQGLRLMASERDLPLAWPVEVNLLEAEAYANWYSSETSGGWRLPSEREWQRMHAVSTSVGNEPANIGLRHASSCDNARYAQGPLYDVVGNVWQWTTTPIYPLPGFKRHPIYDDFSWPTFDGRHAIMKGGSWISTGNEADPRSRYAFRRHFFQHAGFRLIK